MVDVLWGKLSLVGAKMHGQLSQIRLSRITFCKSILAICALT